MITEVCNIILVFAFKYAQKINTFRKSFFVFQKISRQKGIKDYLNYLFGILLNKHIKLLEIATNKRLTVFEIYRTGLNEVEEVI